MSALPLVGTWTLESCELVTSDGEVDYPFGRTPVGYIMYGQDGYMSVVIMSADRPPFRANDILGGTSEEKIAAIDTYLSYCGRYETIGEKVLHRIEASLFPNWIGTTLERIVTLQGDTLRLSTEPFLVKSRTQTGHLVWKRVRNA